MNTKSASPANHGVTVLTEISRRGGSVAETDLRSADVVAAERLGPVLAALYHNGYILRFFGDSVARVELTDQGRDWAAQRGIELPPAPAPRPITIAPPAPAPAAAPAAALAPAKQAVPSESAAGEAAAEKKPRRAVRKKPAEQPSDSAAEKLPEKKVETDDSGFVTHIGGKKIF